MTGFQADAAKLARHADEFPSLAERANKIHGELAAALDAAGPCWGDDPAGHSFADGHVQPAAKTLDQLGALQGRLTDVGNRFTATAHAYQQSDADNADRLTGVGDRFAATAVGYQQTDADSADRL